MQLAGEEVFDQQPDFVWPRLVDLRFAAGAIGGLESIERNEPHHVECQVRPRLSFFSGKLKLTLRVVEQHPPKSTKMRMQAKGIGVGLTVETTAELSPRGQGTLLAWSGEVVEMTGLLKTLSRSLIEAAAREIIADAWKGIREALDKDASTAG